MENEELNQEFNKQIGQFVYDLSTYVFDRIFGIGQDANLVDNAIQIIDNYTPGVNDENDLTVPINPPIVFFSASS